VLLSSRLTGGGRERVLRKAARQIFTIVPHAVPKKGGGKKKRGVDQPVFLKIGEKKKYPKGGDSFPADFFPSCLPLTGGGKRGEGKSLFSPHVEKEERQWERNPPLVFRPLAPREGKDRSLSHALPAGGKKIVLPCSARSALEKKKRGG